MARCHIAAFAAAAVYNDTAVKNDDVAKMSATQLVDERNRLITVTEVFDAKGDKITGDETKQYREAVDRLEAVSNALTNTAIGQRERRDTLVATSRISQATGGIVNLQGGVTTRPLWEDDKEKYGYRNQQDFLNSVVNSYRNREVADPRMRRLVMDAIGSDEFSKANWEAQGLMVPRGFISDVMQLEPEADQLSGLMTRIPMTAPTEIGRAHV